MASSVVISTSSAVCVEPLLTLCRYGTDHQLAPAKGHSRSVSLVLHHFITLSNEPGCLSLSSPNVIAVAYILMLVTDTIVAFLTLFKGIEHLRPSTHPFLTELYASGMLFYVCIFIVSLVNILVPVWVSNLTASLACFQHIFHSILCNRVMLLILKQRQHYSTEETYTDSIELSDTTQ
ncbi:hypothetical protein DFS33DRAFT_1387621 [Desarmillaria ectypa]|nr:hypothetical protein DFS33DRAFT_1387621 [Desarmillaria ectypa]